MSDQLERIQKYACKIIFSWGVDYEDLVENGKVERMSTRRERIALNFAIRTEKNPRFRKWFPKKNYNGVELRTELEYEERFARTERLKKSPLFFI